GKMKLFVPKESAAGERRAAISADAVKKLTAQGFAVSVEQGAGMEAGIADEALSQMGASTITDAIAAAREADVMLCVQLPPEELRQALRSGALLIGMLAPFNHRAELETLVKQGVLPFALEFLPRTSRAQSMDVLSSQSNLAGYRAVIEGAQAMGKAFPMLMT